MLLLSLLLASCGDDLGSLGRKDPLLGECGTFAATYDRFTRLKDPSLDILVVIDDSGGMVEEQEILVFELPGMVQDLLVPPTDPVTGQPVHVPVADLHFGVVGTDMGTGGYPVEGCSDPVAGFDGELRHEPATTDGGCEGPFPEYLEYLADEPDPAAVAEASWNSSAGSACYPSPEYRSPAVGSALHAGRSSATGRRLRSKNANGTIAGRALPSRGIAAAEPACSSGSTRRTGIRPRTVPAAAGPRRRSTAAHPASRAPR